MHEGVLQGPGDRGPVLAADELLPLERAQRVVQLPLVAATEREQRVRPDDLAENGGVPEHLLLGRRQEIDPRGDDPLHGVREPPLDRATSLEHANELLCVQGISGCAIDERALRLGLEHRAIEEREHEPGRRRLVERRQRDRGRVALPPTPARPAVEQLRPRRGDDEERNPTHPVDETVDEVEQPIVGPVQVLEHENRRARVRDRLEKATPRGEGLTAPVARGVVAPEPDQWAQMALDPAPLLLVR